MRRIKFWAAAAVFGMSFLGQAFGQNKGDEVVVIVEKTDLRSEATVVTTTYRGDYLTVREVNGNWLWVDSDGYRGWLQRDHVILASRAIEHFTNELRRNPKDEDAFIARAIAWQDRGELTNAIRDCTDAIAINPKRSWAFKIRGNAWKAKGEIDLAIADYDEGMRLRPDDNQFYLCRGGCHYDKKNYDAAIDDFTEAIRLNPKSAANYKDRGDAYRGKDQVDKAISDYTMAIELDPKLESAFASRGWTYRHKKGDFEKALADYSTAISLNPKWAPYHVSRGGIYCKLKKYDEALADHSKAIELDPTSSDAFVSRAWIYLYEKNNYQKALADCSKAISIDEKFAGYRWLRGKAYFGMGKYDLALQDYVTAIELNQDDSRAHNSMAWLLATCPLDEFRDGKRAVEHATEAIGLTKDKIERACYLDTLAAAYAELGDFTKAVETQKLALADINPENRAECEKHLHVFESGKPYRDLPKTEVATTAAN